MAVAVTACTVGPDYEPPETPMPEGWAEPVASPVVPDAFAGAAWWEVLQDERMTQLISRAVEGNLSLAGAVARIEQSRAIRRQVAATNYPDVDGTASFQRTGVSQNASVFPVPDMSTYNVGVDMVWEIDLFGRIRRSVESADAQLESSIEDYRDLLTVLQAEVGVTYVQLRTLQRRLDLLQDNVVLQESSRDLARARFETGLSPELDVFQAESNLASTQAQLPGIKLEISRAMHRLAVLVGEHAGALRAELAVATPLPLLPENVAIGIPAELLRRRPDIRRAERQLAAQHARIGAAEAALYPIFNISGALGLSAMQVDRLWRRDNSTFSIVPGMRWNLFDFGRVRGAVAEERALTEQAYLAYDNTVLLAIEEAENAIAAFLRERERRAALERVVSASRRSAELAQELYKEDLSDFQNVLDAQRTLFNAQDGLAESEGACVGALISLFRALGGGWQPEVDAEEESSR